MLPFSEDLIHTAQQVRQVFYAYVASGFTEPQALELIKAHIRASGGSS